MDAQNCLAKCTELADFWGSSVGKCRETSPSTMVRIWDLFTILTEHRGILFETIILWMEESKKLGRNDWVPMKNCQEWDYNWKNHLPAGIFKCLHLAVSVGDPNRTSCEPEVFLVLTC